MLEKQRPSIHYTDYLPAFNYVDTPIEIINKAIEALDNAIAVVGIKLKNEQS